MGGVAQWVARLTRTRWMSVSREFEPHQRLRCFLGQETLLSSLISTDGSQGHIKVIYISKSACFTIELN